MDAELRYSSRKSLDETIGAYLKETASKSTGKRVMSTGEDHNVPFTDYGEAFGASLSTYSGVRIRNVARRSGSSPMPNVHVASAPPRTTPCCKLARSTAVGSTLG